MSNAHRPLSPLRFGLAFVKHNITYQRHMLFMSQPETPHTANLNFSGQKKWAALSFNDTFHVFWGESMSSHANTGFKKSNWAKQWKTLTVAAASLTVIVAFQNCSSTILSKSPTDISAQKVGDLKPTIDDTASK
jgi:hypothetical protein